MIEPIVANTPGIFDRATLLSLLKNAATINSIDARTLETAVTRYFARGMNRDAIAYDYSGVGKSARSGRRPGPKARSGRISEVVVDDALERLFKEAQTVYRTNRDKSLHDTFVDMLEAHFSYVDHRGRLKLLADDALPTFRQYQYFYNKTNDRVEVRKQRDGKRKFELTQRELLSNSMFGIMGPGHRYQVDATIWKVRLVERDGSRREIGSPTVYFAVDVFSRDIGGFSVSLDPPSWLNAASVFVNCAEDKVEFCRRHGINIDPEDWPTTGIPREIVGDRGELIGPVADALVDGLGVVLSNTPSYRADFKGVVESRFEVINVDMKGDIVGQVTDNPVRGEKETTTPPALDMDQFVRILIHTVLAYRQVRIANYPLSDTLVAAGVPSVPSALWTWGITNLTGALTRRSPRHVMLTLLPRATAKISKNGISFRGRMYSSDLLRKTNAFSRARTEGEIELAIVHDPRLIDDIHFEWASAEDSYEIATLTGPFHQFRGMSEKEFGDLKNTHKQINVSADRGGTEAVMTSRRNVREIVEQGNAMTAAARPAEMSKRAISGNKKVARLEEARARRSEKFAAVQSSPANGNGGSLPRAEASHASPQADSRTAPDAPQFDVDAKRDVTLLEKRLRDLGLLKKGRDD